jgi:Glutamine phosphoribosylpyrophosphate amidotransferase
VLASGRVGAEGPKEECGVFGVWAPGDDVARLTYFALFAQQHRGQEAAGMAVSDGEHILVFKELGLVSQVFDEATLSTLRGDLGIGHNRYSTTGSTTWENAQPAFKTDGQRSLALGHNGNLVNTLELAEVVGPGGASTTDSDLVATILARHPSEDLESALVDVLPTLKGAFSFVVMDERSLFAARDPHGCGRSRSAACRTASASRPRPVRSISWARRSCATSSRASWCGSTSVASSRRGSGRPSAPRSASSSSCTWRVRTRACGTTVTRSVASWDDGSRSRRPPTAIW